MNGGFSVELTQRVKAYYVARGVSLSDDQAHEYLVALADLYEEFARMCAAGDETAARASARRPSADLISPHSC